MTSKWRERLLSPSWSRGERVYVITLWAVIVISLAVLIVMGILAYDTLQASSAP